MGDGRPRSGTGLASLKRTVPSRFDSATLSRPQLHLRILVSVIEHLGRGAALTAVVAVLGAGPAHAAFTRPQATALANAAVLRAGDVPGFTASGATAVQAFRDDLAQYAKCSGGVPPTESLAVNGSPEFAGRVDSQVVQSYVEVLPSPALVTKDLGVGASSRGRSCVDRATERTLRSETAEGNTFAHFTTSHLTVPVAGASGSYGERIRATVSFNGQSRPYYGDTLYADTGRVEITLLANSLTKPVAAGTEAQLLAVLVRRADALPH